MKQVNPDDDWPEVWKYSYNYDRLEIYGDLSCRGYTYAYLQRRAHALNLITSSVMPGGSILDVAAAQGNFSLTLAELGYRVTWNDLREDLAEYVKLKHDRGYIEYAPGNVFELGLNVHFDLVLTTEIIEHVAHPDEFLKKIAGLVRVGGAVVLTTPNGEYFLNRLPKFSDCADTTAYECIQFGPNSENHIFLLHTDEVYALAAQAGLCVEEVRLFNNPLTNGHVKLGYALRCVPRPVVEMLEKVSRRLPQPIARRTHAGMAALLRRVK